MGSNHFAVAQPIKSVGQLNPDNPSNLFRVIIWTLVVDTFTSKKANRAVRADARKQMVQPYVNQPSQC